MYIWIYIYMIYIYIYIYVLLLDIEVDAPGAHHQNSHHKRCCFFADGLLIIRTNPRAPAPRAKEPLRVRYDKRRGIRQEFGPQEIVQGLHRQSSLDELPLDGTGAREFPGLRPDSLSSCDPTLASTLRR